jgi:hypothetical protein
MHRRTARTVMALLGAGVLLTSGAFAASATTARVAVPPAGEAQIASLLAALSPDARVAGYGSVLTDGSVTTANWRTKLAPVLSALAALHADRSITAPVQGSVLAGTLHLPATMELTGDTTLVANTLALSARSLRVHAHGHTLHLFPINAITAPAPRATSAGAASLAATSITIDLSGTRGTDGSNGGYGQSGEPGNAGYPGREMVGFTCATDGGPGDDGTAGLSGDPGGPATDGTAGGPVTVDIPDGSTDSYTIITNGGRGGDGGTGGTGGTGGGGGQGGDGGSADNMPLFDDSPCPGQGPKGGDGGTGGDAGDGGPGGNAGNGGNSGSITVTYGAGYDPALITTQYEPGLFGFPGGGGTGGSGGPAGIGGMGGSGALGFPPGGNGTEGLPGITGSNGPLGLDGIAGTAGQVSILPR